MYSFFWIFFIYAFLGWCTEVSYAALVSGRFVNRGFLNGPVCPIYGFGVVVVLACLTPLKECLPLLFLGSVLLTSALEWLTGFVLERIFHQRWWDYSDEPFNLNGYICLRFSIAWGLACLFVVELLHPTVLLFIRIIPHSLGWVLLGMMAVLMAVDLVATVRTIAKINRQLDRIDELACRIKEASNDFGEHLAERVLDAAERGTDLKEDLDDWMDERTMDMELNLGEWKEELDELKDDLAQRRALLLSRQNERRAVLRDQLAEWKEDFQALLDHEAFGQRRLLNAFPKMRSIRHKNALEQLRRRVDHRKKDS